MNRYILIKAIQFIAIYALGQAINIKQLNSEELSSTLSSGEIILIDVRTPGEFANGHIADAGAIELLRP